MEAAAPTAADGKKVYPQYFLDALECAGGIAWDGAWRTTDAGRAALAPTQAATARPSSPRRFP